MAAAKESIETIVPAGLKATYNAAESEGHKCEINGGRSFLHVLNGSGGSLTVTIKGGLHASRSYTDRTVTVPDGEQKLIQLQPSDDRGGDDRGLAEFTFSSTTSVTFACLQLS